MGDAAAHAVLSPSSASRWMACTPSARFEEQFPNEETIFAKEGTLAHAISELIIKMRLGIIDEFAYDLELEQLQSEELYSPEMLTYCEQYADYCLQGSEPDHVHAVETKLDITAYIPEGFGTGDYMRVIPRQKKIIFRDLKYGKGVPVSAVNNTQLKVYALGALAWWGWVYDIEVISVGIYQPRLNNNSEWEITVPDLLRWAVEELAPKAKTAFAGEGQYVAGNHCKFCRARVRCQTLADYNLDLFKHELKKHDQLSDDELVSIIKKASILSSWVDDLKEYMLAEAVKGKKWAGMKLVEGKSNRVFVSESQTEKKLLDAGYNEIYTPKQLLGITKLQKSIGAKAFREIVESGLRKPAGTPTLVTVDDPRPEFDNAAAVFKDAIIKDEVE
jgi:hypothetical protein